MLKTMAAGPDPRDPVATASPDPDDLEGIVALPDEPSALKGLRVGVPGGYFAEDNDPEVDRVMREVETILADAGAEFVEVNVADVELATPAGFAIVVPETIMLMQGYWWQVDPSLRIEDQLDNFGPDVRQVLGGEKGPEAKPVPAHAYLEAVYVTREKVKQGFNRALQNVDMLLTPTTPSPAVPLEEHVEMMLNGVKVNTFVTFIKYVFCVSIAGLPSISVPGGQTKEGLPVGIQLVGRPWSEAQLIQAAWAFENLVSD
jgi:Asp-tRNA(Asn)/Glu-tRNA(Gln) amidotransferase A subunit family amidase